MSQIMRYNNGGSPAPGTVLFLEGDIGGQVGPDGTGTIHVITDNAANNGGATFLVDGNPGDNTLIVITTDVNNNTQMGFNAGNIAQSGSRNTSLGAESQSIITSGSDNTSLGYQTLDLLTSGLNNVAIGSQAGANLSTTSQNTFVGMQAGQNSTSSGNTGIGHQALRAVTAVIGDNTAIGRVALTSSTTGSFNVAIGTAAAQFNTTGSNNVIIGVSAGAPTAGEYNTAVGRQALGYNGILPVPTTSSFNTVLGAAALIGLKTGQYNTVIGGVTSGGLANGAGNAYAGAESSNLIIVNDGVVGDNNTIRIGRQGAGVGQQNRNFQAGIFGVTPAGTLNMTIIDNNGQLGSAPLSPSTLFPWSQLTGSTTAAVNNGYFINSVGSMNLALPATSAVGDVIKVIVVSAGSTLVFTQAAGQQILLSSASTTLGAAGTLTSTGIGCTITLVCRTANTVWWAESFVNTWTTA